MSAPAFKLEEAGFSKPQIEALSEFMQTEAARRSDLLQTEYRLDTRLNEARAELKTELARQDGKITLLPWMMGFVLAFLAAIAGKLFLAH